MNENPEISSADSLRLNVLLTQQPQALRIDESSMVLHALTARGEVRLRLDPNCDDATYLRRVRELLSAQVMGSPGGYPVFLERWTRMGQVRDSILEQLLLLGESEAVVAVAHAPGLTETLARRVWWAMPDAANARQMLKNPAVAASPTGRELAAFLLEFLPFEEAAGSMLESVRLVLQPGLVDAAEIERLWQRALKKRSMLVGFLLAMPDALPLQSPAHSRLASPALATGGGAEIELMRRVFSPAGQAFVKTCEMALAKVIDQEVTVQLFDAISRYFAGARPFQERYREVAELEHAVDRLDWRGDPQLETCARSIWFLAAIGVDLLDPIFGRTDAVGSGMRKKIKPLTDRIFHHLQRLGGGA